MNTSKLASSGSRSIVRHPAAASPRRGSLAEMPLGANHGHTRGVSIADSSIDVVLRALRLVPRVRQYAAGAGGIPTMSTACSGHRRRVPDTGGVFRAPAVVFGCRRRAPATGGRLRLPAVGFGYLWCAWAIHGVLRPACSVLRVRTVDSGTCDRCLRGTRGDNSRPLGHAAREGGRRWPTCIST